MSEILYEAADRLRRVEKSDTGRRQQWEKVRPKVMERMQGRETTPEQGQAPEGKSEQVGREIPSSDNSDAPKGIWPATASTEIGAARRAETGAEKKEVKNFDAETRLSGRPEGWRPGGPEGRG